MYKIYKSEKEIKHHTDAIKTVETDGRTYIKISCTNGYIKVLELQAEGKRKMKTDEFLRGNKI